MNEEERDVAESVARDGQAVNTTINTKGWINVIRPALDARLKSLVKEFANTTEYEEFVRIQQAINAISNLTSFIEVTLAEGKDALKNLEKSP